LKIVFAGTTHHAASVLRHLSQSMHEVVAVLTREDAPVGRKSVLTPSPVAVLASELGFPLVKTNRPGDAENQQLETFAPDLGVVIAYGALLKAATLNIPKHGWLNLHYSLLPKWRGAAPVQHAILNGDRETGVTIFKLDEGMDTGDIVSQVETEIQPRENTEDLLERLTNLGISLLDETLAKIDGGIAQYREQTGESTQAGKLSRLEAKIDWNTSCHGIDQLVRAMNPEPIAWSTSGNDSIRIIDAQASTLTRAIPVGHAFLESNRAYISCGGGTVLELLQVQPAGKNRMNAVDWLRGQNSEVVLGG